MPRLPRTNFGAPVESLIELVAASFARHGIDCPAADLRSAEPVAAASVEPMPGTMPGTAVRPDEAVLRAVLPEHNFRKGPASDPA
jgi:hypothetical protein